jgi:hypothetical protein
MSAPPQAIGPNPHTNLLNAYIQIVNKMGFKKKLLVPRFSLFIFSLLDHTMEMYAAAHSVYSAHVSLSSEFVLYVVCMICRFNNSVTQELPNILWNPKICGGR